MTSNSAAKAKKKIGILTGGGDCPGLNAVIRAASLTAIKEGHTVIGIHDGFEGLYEGSYVELDPDKVLHIYNAGGTILGTTNVGHFNSPLSDEAIEKSVSTYKKLGLDCLICIGGDGTHAIASQLTSHGLNIVGVPKTIDNDLTATDQTFGQA